WFSDGSGLSRFAPGPESPRSRHVPRIREVKIAGVPVPVPAVGSSSIGPIVVAPSQRTVEIGYFAVDHGPGQPPRFQHRLGGAEDGWSAPTATRSVLYAGLVPGGHRFEVRAVEADGDAVSEAAVVDLEVLAPFWRRGWFLALAFSVTAAFAYGAHRLRMARAIAVERVRTRIATELHHEIGSSLPQISVLSQFAERDVARESGASPPSLSRIADLARAAVEAMGETVWAISPREDRLSDLVFRMRRVALDLFADGGEITLDLPSVDTDERLDPEIRRTLYLVFKEALHNARTHAGAAHVAVWLRREGAGLTRRVKDDGRGFETAASSRGHGLPGMRRRSRAIGGEVEVRSSVGGGTEVMFRVPSDSANLFRRIVGRGR